MTATTTRRAPLSRLLQIVIALQSDRRPNARQLAEECEVSRRTVFRDIEAIEAAGLPVRYDATRQGYYLEQEATARRPALEEREVLALAVLANSGSERDAFGLTGAARAGLLKLVAGLPEASRRRAEAIDLATRPEAPANPPEEPRRLVHERLLEALLGGVHVRLVVREPGRGLERTLLAPYRMFPTSGGWCLAGRSSLHRRVRLFSLASVESVELTDEPAAVPPRFRVDRWLGRSCSGEPGAGLGRSEIHLRFDAEVAPTIRDGRWHTSQRVEVLPDGRVDLRLTLDRPEDLAPWVLGQGVLAEVLAPARLRKAVRRLATRVARRNARPRRGVASTSEFGGLGG